MLRHIFEPLIRRADERGDDVFCHFIKNGQAVDISVRQIVAQARRLAARLRGLQLPHGGIVLIVLEHREELYSVFIGASLAGLVPSFLPPMTRKQDPEVFARSMTALLDRIDPAAVVVSEASRHDVDAGNRIVLSTAELLAEEDALEGAGSPLLSGSVAFLQHSSGTTGLKKGVLLSHEAVIEQARLYASAINLTDRDVVVSWLPLYHDMGFARRLHHPGHSRLPDRQL